MFSIFLGLEFFYHDVITDKEYLQPITMMKKY